MTKIELQYMDAVIQTNRRQRTHEIDWEERRYELTKAALAITPFGWNCSDGEPTADRIAKRAMDLADATIKILMTTEDSK